MEVNCDGMTSAPSGQSNQAAYVVTDDGMIDGGNDVSRNASPPNDKNVSLLSSLMIMMMMMMMIPIEITLVGIITFSSDGQWEKAPSPSIIVIVIMMIVVVMMMMMIPIVVTLVGIVTAVSPVHPWKACWSKDKG